MSTVKTYDPDLVSVAVGAFFADSFTEVRVEPAEDRFEFSTDSSGRVVSRSRIRNPLGAIILVVPQTSDFNDILSAFANSGALIPCAVIDRGGSSKHLMAQGTVVQIPASKYGRAAEDVEWTIRGPIDDPHIKGGNN